MEPGGHYNSYHHHHPALQYQHPVDNVPIGSFQDYQSRSGLMSDAAASLIGSPHPQAYSASINGATSQIATPQLPEHSPLDGTAPISSTAQISSVVPGPSSSDIPVHYFNPPTMFDQQNLMELYFEDGEATVERGQIEETLPKKKKNIERKNQFFPNKSTAMNIWARSESSAEDIATITEEVDEMIKTDSEISSDRRMTLINERRAKFYNGLSSEQKKIWEAAAKESESKSPDFGSLNDKMTLVRSKIMALRKDCYEAFGFPFIGVVFTPDGDSAEPTATLYDCDGLANDRLGFTSWLLQDQGRRAQSIFLAQLNKYARHVYESAPAPAGDRAHSVAPVAKQTAVKGFVNTKTQMGEAWVDGLRMIPPIDGLNAQDLRGLYTNAVYDRWKRAGYTENHVPWQRIGDNNEHFVQAGVLPPTVKIVKPEAMGKANIRAVLQLFIKQQKNGRNEDGNPGTQGLLFLPCGTGASLLPKAKRGVRAPDATLIDSSVPVDTIVTASTSAIAPSTSNAVAPLTSNAVTSLMSNAIAPFVSKATAITSGHVDATPPTSVDIATDAISPSPLTTDTTVSVSLLDNGNNGAPTVQAPPAPPVATSATTSSSLEAPPTLPPAMTNTPASVPLVENAISAEDNTNSNSVAPAVPAPPTLTIAADATPSSSLSTLPNPPIVGDAMTSASLVDNTVSAYPNKNAGPAAPATDISAAHMSEAGNIGTKTRPGRKTTQKAPTSQVGSKRKAETNPDNRPTRRSTRRADTGAAPTD